MRWLKKVRVQESGGKKRGLSKRRIVNEALKPRSREAARPKLISASCLRRRTPHEIFFYEMRNTEYTPLFEKAQKKTKNALVETTDLYLSSNLLEI